ncbi:MAG: alpha/beta hydrolase [Devosia sp.]
MSLTEATIETPNASIRITDSGGSGLPVLLLHGSGSSRRVFDRQMMSPLAGHYRMIAPDLPGHGESSDARDVSRLSYTLPGLARSVGALIDALGLGKVAVVGWSLGGHLALELMDFHPAVAGVMVMGAPPIGRGPIALFRAFRTNLDTTLASKPKFSDAEIMRFARLCFGYDIEPTSLDSIRRADGQLRKVMFGSMMSGACVDEKALVETSDTPVAIVNGSDDPFIRLRYIAGLRYRNLWEGMCHVIPDAGHDAFRSHADSFNPLLGRFADAIAARVAQPRQAVTAPMRLTA